MSALDNTPDKIYKPYTYMIGWSIHEIYYYGVRYTKNCNPNDLWKTYFTSSKYVKEFRKLHGEPDIIKIRKTFENGEKALLWEQKVLKKLRIKTNNKWLNVAIGKPTMLGKKHSEETKEKMRKPKPLGFAEKISKKMKNYQKTEEHCKKISIALTGKKLSKESIKKRTETYRKNFDNGLYNIGKTRLGKKRGPYKKKVKQ
jgi:hypothetical protein